MFAPKVAGAQTKAAENPTRKLAPNPSTLVARPFDGGAFEQVLMPHGTIGNQAMLRSLAQRLPNVAAKVPADRREQEAGPENMTALEAPRGRSWNFSKIPVFPPHRTDQPHPSSRLAATPLPGAIQAKIVLGQADDPLEPEAERVADRSMRIPPRPSLSRTMQHVSRICASGQTAAPPLVHEVMRSPGQPLDQATRDFMETRFGYDFSRVRVHSGTAAEQSARDVNAKAYTSGHDIVFGAGQYMPDTPHGAHILAHELAHVVQQHNGQSQALQRKPTDGDIADLELQLQSKLSERALLGRMLDDLDKRQDQDVYQQRIDTPSKDQEAHLKAQAQAGRTIAHVMDATTVQLLQNMVDIVKTQDGFTLNIRFEISYEGLSDKDGADRAARDIPRIEKAIGEAWTVDLTSGHYAGSKFRTDAHIKFRTNAAQPNDKSLQLFVRREAKGDSFLVGAFPGRGTAISFNPKHLEGDEVITAAHELYHVFGFSDAWYIPLESERRKHPHGPASTYVVGRKDPGGRGDLLGMPRKAKLRDWRDKNLISQADFDRQTRTQLRVWQEDADTILYVLGAPPPVPNSRVQNNPASPAFDPEESLRAQEADAKEKLANRQRASDRNADSDEFVLKAERAMQLDKEIAELKKTIADRKTPQKP